MKFIQFRVTDEQAKQLQENYERSICRSLADYIRQCLFDGHIILSTRNGSIDDLIQELLATRKGLWDLRKVFSQLADPMSNPATGPEHILLTRTLAKSLPMFFKKTDEIGQLMIKIYDQFLCTPN